MSFGNFEHNLSSIFNNLQKSKIEFRNFELNKREKFLYKSNLSLFRIVMKFTEMVDSELKTQEVDLGSQSCRFRKNAFFKWQLWGPFEVENTKFHMVEFQLRVKHLREFHQNPGYVFFRSTL